MKSMPKTQTLDKKRDVKDLIAWVVKDELLEAINYFLQELDKPNGPTKNIPSARRVLNQVISKLEGTD